MTRARLSLVFGSTFAGLALILVVAYWISPWIYASSIESAARASDLAVLARRIDAVGLVASATDTQQLVPAGYRISASETVDEPLRRRINDSIRDTVGSDPAFIQKLANLLMGRGMATQDLLDVVPKHLVSRRTPEFSSESGPTLDTYAIHVAFRETGEQVTLVLQRKGWFTWRAARLVSSSGTVTWPLKTPRGV